ncbi:MAG: hypothetical protein A2664_00245 [Candidatus Taylorbacteria bacterium RIFCSPHIGHO2_01_FULL_46_22b]|uniref:Uncharacterized protein n=1 Tax=Candidatus Taylorbacteria bacterium RIFCSPHIGHO2_01_FULL_46_22b TaxID=1802301 RepID=A0A1G2M4F3_9BACT|nr:MAG: hypothetical protein A2664_00245 [Candidatus Taylorbacteria bacterium RIFCSPHIGHO2_01_FULL_46_22b]
MKTIGLVVRIGCNHYRVTYAGKKEGTCESQFVITGVHRRKYAKVAQVQRAIKDGSFCTKIFKIFAPIYCVMKVSEDGTTATVRTVTFQSLKTGWAIAEDSGTTFFTRVESFLCVFDD